MLRGALDDFALTDIFRLIALARRTGRLEVSRQAGRGLVFFQDGDVYFAESSLVREPLGQKLVRAGVLTEGQLRRALDSHAATGTRLGQILVSSGWVGASELEEAVRGQTEDAVFDLLRWEVGEFVWEPGERIDVEVPVAVSVENLIMEASRRIDEMEIITRKIPSAAAVPAMASKPPEGAVEINITPDEWRMLVLVNGSRSVGEIADAVGIAAFDTMKTIYGLLSAGLVEIVSTGEGDRDVDGRRTVEGLAAMPASAPPEIAEPAAEYPFRPEPLAPEAAPEAFEEPKLEARGAELLEEELEREIFPEPGVGAAEVAEPELEGAVEEPFVPAPHEAEPDLAPTPPVSIQEEAEPDLAPTPPVSAQEEAEPDLAPTPPVSAQEEAEPDLAPTPPVSVQEEAEPDLAPTPLVSAEEEAEPDLAPKPPPSVEDQAAPDVSPTPPTSVEDDAKPEPEAVGPGQPAPAEQEEAPSVTQDAPRQERSAAMRELAGVWSDADQPARGAASARPPASQPPPPEPDRRKRVEDDEDLDRGLIARLIDGVKGL